MSGFNPRPARRPGAAPAWWSNELAGWMFQSSPGPKAGRCLFRLWSLPCDMRGFNPRPARRPGAASEMDVLLMPSLSVSILARPEGRALQYCVKQAWTGSPEVSILARPEGRALPS